MFIEQKKLSFHMFLNNLFTSWKSIQALKERGITVTRTVWKQVTDYSPCILMFKIANRTLEWDHLEATIIHEIACWLWQDSNTITNKFLYYLFLFYFLSRLFLELFNWFLNRNDERNFLTRISWTWTKKTSKISLKINNYSKTL